MVLDEDLAPVQESVQESETAELVSQQVSTYFNREINTDFHQIPPSKLTLIWRNGGGSYQFTVNLLYL